MNNRLKALYVAVSVPFLCWALPPALELLIIDWPCVRHEWRAFCNGQPHLQYVDYFWGVFLLGFGLGSCLTLRLADYACEVYE